MGAASRRDVERPLGNATTCATGLCQTAEQSRDMRNITQLAGERRCKGPFLQFHDGDGSRERPPSPVRRLKSWRMKPGRLRCSQCARARTSGRIRVRAAWAKQSTGGLGNAEAAQTPAPRTADVLIRCGSTPRVRPEVSMAARRSESAAGGDTRAPDRWHSAAFPGCAPGAQSSRSNLACGDGICDHTAR